MVGSVLRGKTEPGVQGLTCWLFCDSFLLPSDSHPSSRPCIDSLHPETVQGAIPTV